jgi:hypothetical protein
VDGHVVPMSAAERRLAERLVKDPPDGFLPLVHALAKTRCRFPVAQAVLMWRNLPGMWEQMRRDDEDERAGVKPKQLRRRR